MRCHRIGNHFVTSAVGVAILAVSGARGAPELKSIPAWEGTNPLCRVVAPSSDVHAAQLVRSTINGYLSRSYGVELPVAADVRPGRTYIVAGTAANNPTLASLLSGGLKLTEDALGDEGYQLLSHEAGGSRYVIIHGTTPRALKYGCQELVFYRMPATTTGGRIEWPLTVTMRPAFSYRGIYMLPCWAAFDSFASWKRVLRFNSELTVNRNWFWLDGFPVAGHTGMYEGTDLAKPENVQRLFDLVVQEDMKILIGGGWFNWHHEKAVGRDLRKGIDYYLDYIDAFKNFHGFYIEPTGEGRETARWHDQCDALCRLIHLVLQRRGEFEFALAIGKFNNPAYLERVAQLDPKRVFWWWCWGDPIRDKALDRYPSVLRWHVIVRMSDFHGSMAPPEPRERRLTGIATSYDPGQGFGNPWDGWGKLGVKSPRNFHPHTIPYFAHQYFYRERCWDLAITEKAFTERLQRRLFDADAPKEAGRLYWRLSMLALDANQKRLPATEQLTPIRGFLTASAARSWTPRTEDTLLRMKEALSQLQQLRRDTGK